MKPTWSRRSNKLVPSLEFWRPLAYCAAALLVAGRIAAAAEPVDFVRDVRPILAARCFTCHGPDKQESDLRLDSAQSLAAGGNSGPAFVAGKSVESILVQAITGAGDVSKMPPEGEGLSADQVALVKRWIDEGAKLPDESAPQPTRRTSDHWSFQPLNTPAPPQVKQPDWVRNPIDAFILARLEATGLRPSPEADRPTLIRRLSLDLLGHHQGPFVRELIPR